MKTTRHFLEIDDLSPDELTEVLNRSEQENLPECLSKKSVALFFEKPSARTSHSAEVAIMHLGGHPIYTRPEEVGIDTRETAEDAARLWSGYHAAIAARVFHHSVLERMATHASIPVINLLSDDSHPVQALADLLTIRQEFGTIEGKTIAFIGDANNVAFSLAVGADQLGAHFVLSHPEEYGFNERAAEKLASRNQKIESFTNPHDAVREADVIYTDTWYSMGQEAESVERRDIFSAFQVNDELMAQAKPDAIFMHCLPAHRGEEATDSVLDGTQSRIWPQAYNRMHTKRGLLSFLLE